MVLATDLIRALMLEERKKTIVFFERIDSAEDVQADVTVEAATKLRSRIQENMTIWCRVYHSGLRQAERDQVLREFEASKQSVLLACRCLDEGKHIPDLEAAIIVASTQSLRQRIQRVGRVIHRGDGNKRPLVVTFFCEDTRDQNVVQNDKEVFAGVATFYETDEHSCLKIVKELIKGGRLI